MYVFSKLINFFYINVTDKIMEYFMTKNLE